MNEYFTCSYAMLPYLDLGLFKQKDGVHLCTPNISFFMTLHKIDYKY